MDCLTVSASFLRLSSPGATSGSALVRGGGRVADIMLAGVDVGAVGRVSGWLDSRTLRLAVYEHVLSHVVVRVATVRAQL